MPATICSTAAWVTTLQGGDGFDTLHGDSGNDTLNLKNSSFGGSAYGGEGFDLLIGGDITCSTLDGGAGNDTLRAGAAGADLVDFDGGNDRLIGGTGDDVYLGAQEKTCSFSARRGPPDSDPQDVIADFEDGLNKIDLRGSGLSIADWQSTIPAIPPSSPPIRGTNRSDAGRRAECGPDHPGRFPVWLSWQ